GGHQCVLSSRNTRLVEKYVGAGESRNREANETFVESHLLAELLERKKVCVEAAATDDVASGRRQRDLTAPSEKGRGKEYRRANLRAKLGIEIPRVNFLGVNLERIRRCPFDQYSDRPDQLHQCFDVADVRHV